MSKKIAFGTQPNIKALDELVKSRAEGPASGTAVSEEPQPTRRISVDLPIPLHTSLKLHCVQNGILMADYVRDLIAAQFKSKS